MPHQTDKSQLNIAKNHDLTKQTKFFVAVAYGVLIEAAMMSKVCP